LVFITNEINLGFAGACNRGARAARGESILFLNNDTEALANWWPPLQDALVSRPDIGIVVPKLVFPDGSIQHCGKVWKDITVPNAHSHHIYYRMPADALCVKHSRKYAVATGACMLVRRAEFLSVNGFDAKYCNGWEDDDLCYAYHSKGLGTWYCAESTLIHHQSQTLNHVLDPLSQGQQQTLSRFTQNRAHFFTKWGDQIRRDDFLYYQEDGFTADPDIPRYAPDLRRRLGKPFEQDSALTPHTSKSLQKGLVSIIILTWNQLDYTQQCLASILNNTPEPHEIIFVDNGSTDGTVPWLRDAITKNPHYHLIENQENRGFAAGCNQGMFAATGDYLLLLNNDVVVTKNWLAGLLECLCAHPSSGIVGPMTNNISGVQKVDQVGYTEIEHLELFAAAYRNRYRHRRITCRRIVGFCMLFRRSLIESVGLLDESFGSGNFEDDDYCIRAALEGFTNLIAGDVFIHHYGSASFKGNQLNYSSSMAGNMQIFRTKWSQPVTDELLARKIVIMKALEKAEVCFQKCQLDEAVQTLLHEGIRLIPDEIRFYYALADYLLQAGKPSDALGVLSELPSSKPKSTGAVLTGSCYLALNDLENAQKYASIAFNLDPESASVLTLKGKIALSGNDINAASLFFRHAIDSDPGDGEPVAHLATMMWGSGERVEALRRYECAITLTPTRQLICNAYHAAISTLKQFPRGAAIFQEALHFHPASRSLRFYLIDLLIQSGDFAAAIAEIEQAILLFGADSAMLNAALQVRSQLGPIKIPDDCTATVSLCLITKNEEQHLPRCLANLKAIADEIIVVDTGSTDRTKDIAAIYGAQVSDFPWTGDFSAARNESIRQAKGKWILIMDADEVIAPSDHVAFRKVLAEIQQPFAYELVTRNYNDNASLENWTANDGSYLEYEAGPGWVPSTKIRIFPNHRGIFFEKPVHELVDYAVKKQGIPIFELPIPIHHYGYIDKERLQQKRENYYQLGRKKLQEDGDTNLKALTELAIIAGELKKYQEAIELWLRALEINPEFALAYYNLGSAYLQTDRFADALAASKTALQYKYDYADAAINGATAALCLEEDSEALALLDKIATTAGNMPNYILTRGVLLIMSGENTEGYQLLEKLKDKGVKFTVFINSMAGKLISTGKFKRAGLLLELAQQMGSFDEETLLISKKLNAILQDGQSL